MERILIADDAAMNRELLADIFMGQYETIQASDGEETIAILEKEASALSLILLDLLMPKKSGLDVLLYMQEHGLIDKIPVIMITGVATNENELAAYEYGVADIIHKPYDSKIMVRRVKNVIELYQRRLLAEKELARQAEELRKSHEMLEKNNVFMINALGSVVEFRSAESGEHIHRVSAFTKIILKYVMQLYPEYALSDEQITMIANAASLHDVGKIAIQDNILAKPGKLTHTEFDEMKKHTLYGCDILNRFRQEDNEFYRYCYDICRWHHEKFDGNGYPDCLKGDEIPIWAQVVAIADCFDALVSKRVYKEAYVVEEAYAMIERGECGIFSQKIMNAFFAAKEELIQLHQGKELN